MLLYRICRNRTGTQSRQPDPDGYCHRYADIHCHPDAHTSHFDAYQHKYIYGDLNIHQHTHSICLGYVRDTCHVDPIPDVNSFCHLHTLLDTEYDPDAVLYGRPPNPYTFEHFNSLRNPLPLK